MMAKKVSAPEYALSRTARTAGTTVFREDRRESQQPNGPFHVMGCGSKSSIHCYLHPYHSTLNLCNPVEKLVFNADIMTGFIDYVKR